MIALAVSVRFSIYEIVALLRHQEECHMVIAMNFAEAHPPHELNKNESFCFTLFGQKHRREKTNTVNTDTGYIFKNIYIEISVQQPK